MVTFNIHSPKLQMSKYPLIFVATPQSVLMQLLLLGLGLPA